MHMHQENRGFETALLWDNVFERIKGRGENLNDPSKFWIVAFVTVKLVFVQNKSALLLQTEDHLPQTAY